MPLLAGQSLSFYEILGPLGAGGMGEVYRAKDTRLDRDVAIKVLPEELADDEERLRRFEREAKTLASLNHPNVAGILAYVETVGEATFQLAWWSPGAETESIGRAHAGAIDVSDLSREHGAIFYRTMDRSKSRLWKYDVRRELATEIPVGDQDPRSPLALADGRIAYTVLEMGADGIGYQSYLLPPSGRGEPEAWMRDAYVMDVDANMSHAFAVHVDLKGQGLSVVDLGSFERRTLREDLDGAHGGSLSADGGWALFLAGSPRPEAHLTRFPSGEGEWQVSTDGATGVAFAPDDSAIYYVDRSLRLFRVDLETEPDVVLGSPKLLGQAEVGTQLTARLEARTSERFLAVQSLGAPERRLVVVLDWAAGLAGR